MTAKNAEKITLIPPARPSIPSMKFMALVMPITQTMVITVSVTIPPSHPGTKVMRTPVAIRNPVAAS